MNLSIVECKPPVDSLGKARGTGKSPGPPTGRPTSLAKGLSAG